jgi:hypothetical protein
MRRKYAASAVVAVALASAALGVLVGAGQPSSKSVANGASPTPAQAQTPALTAGNGSGRLENTSAHLRTEELNVFVGSDSLQCVSFRGPKRVFAVSCNWDEFNRARNSPRHTGP